MPPAALHPQDWLLIAEALVEWAGNPNEIESPREERAWELVDMIAIDQALPANELIDQIDDDWGGRDG